MKIFHEAPLQIFDLVQDFTDGDYALVHMLEKNEQYERKIREAISLGRPVILDNSAFELGESFDPEKFVDWIYKLKPTYYVIPDKLRDAEATVGMMDNFLKMFPAIKEGTGSKSIGVVQGTTYTECVWCYEQLVTRCDVIAFNKSYGEPEDTPEVRSKVRPDYIRMMLEDGIIDTSKPHHLLGAIFPQEMRFYQNPKYSFIKSVDTCNPVVYGLYGNIYTENGLDFAMLNQPKIDDWIWSPDAFKAWPMIRYNILMFRRFCNGDRSISKGCLSYISY